MTMTRDEAIHHLHTFSTTMGSGQTTDEQHKEAKRMAIESLSAETEWIPLSHEGLGTDFPYERDGEWVIVTNGSAISVERIKKDAYDHFLPDGRWFELEDVIAWMPLPKPYAERRKP